MDPFGASDDDSSFILHSGIGSDPEPSARCRRGSEAGETGCGPSSARCTPSTPLVATSPNLATRTPRMPTPQTGAVLMTPQPCQKMLSLSAELDREIDEVTLRCRRNGQSTITRLTSAIFVGGFPSPSDLCRLYRENVRTVITVCGGSERISSVPEECEHLQIKTLNTDDASDYFILVTDFDNFAVLMDEALRVGNVLVHCVAGVNRSVTLTAAYMVSRYGHTPLSVVRLFRESGRPVILDNRGFRRQLIEFYLETGGRR